MFTKEQRSTFPYWFAHWCAFQMTALNLRAWKVKYILHDLCKPFLKLVMDYKKVQFIHRNCANHHIEWILNRYDGGNNEIFDMFDWEAMIIDWECSRFTKEASPMTARQQYEEEISIRKGVIRREMTIRIPPILEKLGL